MNAAAQKVSVDLGKSLRDLDLEWRLRNIPANAQMRGLFFNGLRDEVERRGLARVPDLTRLLNVPRKSYALYPVAEIVEACAIAGALVNDDPREGMSQLFVGNTDYVTRTWFGKVFAKYLRPYDALRWLERSRDYIANYGKWRLEYRGEGHAIMHKYDEYFWLDALRGSCEGMLNVCGVRGSVTCELDSPFCGRLVIRW